MPIPFFEKRMSVQQPNGELIPVLGTGNQYFAQFTTLDGTGLVRDPVTRQWQAIGTESKFAHGVIAGPLAIPTSPGLESSGPRWRQRLAERPDSAGLLPSAAVLPPSDIPKMGGKHTVLCLPVDFADLEFTDRPTVSERIRQFCNEEDSAFQNASSVKQYFSTVSNEKLHCHTEVAPVYRAKHESTHYKDAEVPYPCRARALVTEALANYMLNPTGLDELSLDDKGFVRAVCVVYAGNETNGWDSGLHAHSHFLQTPFDMGNGRKAHDYMICAFGAGLTLGLFCHELAHTLCDFPDLYHYGDGHGAGAFCLMGTGGDQRPKNPVHVGAYLKLRAGWGTSRILEAGDHELEAGRNEFFILRRPDNANEYFLIESRHRAIEERLPASGLLVWHVDQNGDNTCSTGRNVPPETFRADECALLQPDGENNLGREENHGDPGDVLPTDKGINHLDGDNRDTDWYDGGVSGLLLSNVSVVDKRIRFRFS